MFAALSMSLGGISFIKTSSADPSGTAERPEELFGRSIFRVRLLRAPVFRRMMPLHTIHGPIIEQSVKHFVIDDVGDDERWNLRRIKHGTDRNGVMGWIVMSQTPPTLPMSPTDASNLDLIVKVEAIEVTVNLTQRMMSPFRGVDPLMPPVQAPAPHAFLNLRTLAEYSVRGSDLSWRPAAQYL